MKAYLQNIGHAIFPTWIDRIEQVTTEPARLALLKEKIEEVEDLRIEAAITAATAHARLCSLVQLSHDLQAAYDREMDV